MFRLMHLKYSSLLLFENRVNLKGNISPTNVGFNGLTVWMKFWKETIYNSYHYAHPLRQILSFRTIFYST